MLTTLQKLMVVVAEVWEILVKKTNLINKF